MASTKQSKHSNPLQTRRAALTTPPGALLRKGGFSERNPVLQAISGRVVASI
jgi:hypothetical protein